jgi:hypothetical protein
MDNMDCQNAFMGLGLRDGNCPFNGPTRCSSTGTDNLGWDHTILLLSQKEQRLRIGYGVLSSH